jgi:hypothetical protein
MVKKLPDFGKLEEYVLKSPPSDPTLVQFNPSPPPPISLRYILISFSHLNL